MKSKADLQLVSSKDMIEELKNRHPHMVFARIEIDDDGTQLEYLDYSGDEGPLLWLCNLLIAAILEVDDDEGEVA